MYYVVDLKLFDTIGVCYMVDRWFELLILHYQNCQYIDESKTELQNIDNFDSKWRPGWLYGGGVCASSKLALADISTWSTPEAL